MVSGDLCDGFVPPAITFVLWPQELIVDVSPLVESTIEVLKMAYLIEVRDGPEGTGADSLFRLSLLAFALTWVIARGELIQIHFRFCPSRLHIPLGPIWTKHNPDWLAFAFAGTPAHGEKGYPTLVRDPAAKTWRGVPNDDALARWSWFLLVEEFVGQLTFDRTLRLRVICVVHC
jgi:hypothetical protein